MGRTLNSKQDKTYHYEVILDDERIFKKTMKDLVEFLQITQTTIFRKMKDNSIILKKYKDNKLIINRINRPVFKTVEIEYIN